MTDPKISIYGVGGNTQPTRSSGSTNTNSIGFEPSLFMEKPQPTEATSAAPQKSDIDAQVQKIQKKLKPGTPKLSNQFIRKVILVAKDIKCDPEDLLAIMYHESRGWNPAEANKKANGEILYGGLIQMNPKALKLVSQRYAKELKLKKNITMNEYLRLPREKQIDYAQGYMRLFKEECQIKKNARLTTGETWGIIKSPRQTKARNKAFLSKQERLIRKIQKEIFVTSNGNKLDVKD